MKVQFMLEFNHELIDEEKFRSLKVVETYHDWENPNIGYEIIEVEVDGIWEIKIIMGDGKTYIAEDADKDKWGVYYVTIWTPFEEEA